MNANEIHRFSDFVRAFPWAPLAASAMSAVPAPTNDRQIATAWSCCQNRDPSMRSPADHHKEKSTQFGAGLVDAR